MKKTFLVLASIGITAGAIIAFQSYATTSTLALPSNNEITALKSNNNQNRLSSQMRDKMLDLLGKIRSKIETLETKTNTLETKTNNTPTITPTDECNCDGNDLCKRNSGKRNCSNLNHIGRFLNDGGFPIDQPYSLTKMAKNSQNLGEKKFCALSSVAFYDKDSSSEWSEHICKVFKLNDTWYLYSNGRQGDSYCSASCF